MRRWVVRILIVVIAISGVGLLWWQMDSQQSSLRLNGQSYHISVLRTQNDLTRGLSGTESLATNEAMVFVFPKDAKWEIWMKDMNYPIDIVWLDSAKNVIYTVKDAQPSSYPKTFKPETDSRYVIELPSGTIERTGIKNGDPAGLPSGV